MGPLQGFRIIEVVGLAAAPYCGMLLADMGADVIRIERPSPRRVSQQSPRDPLVRGKRTVNLDLKSPADLEKLLELVSAADALFEGFRPGVAERLGFGPAVCLERNPKLVFGRLTGWGQQGPYAQMAGHDINYIALTGALHTVGVRGGKPVPPLNLVGDFGGGGLFLAFGMLCALLEAGKSGRGQVVDAAIVDGAASFMAMSHGYSACNKFNPNPGQDILGGRAPFYNTFETSDGKFVSIGAVEPQFFSELLRLTGLSAERFTSAGYAGLFGRPDTSIWDELERELTIAFRAKTRDEWCTLFEGTDACFAPVLTLSEAHEHKHNRERASYIEIDGVVQPAPAPRFSRSRPETPATMLPQETSARAVLDRWLDSRQRHAI